MSVTPRMQVLLAENFEQLLLHLRELKAQILLDYNDISWNIHRVVSRYWRIYNQIDGIQMAYREYRYLFKRYIRVMKVQRDQFSSRFQSVE